MIDVKNIEKSYGGELVLKGVSLKIEKGEFVSIMGESGSGKSTLLGIIGGFLDADRGEVSILGKKHSGLTENEKASLRCTELGFVFQSFKLIPTLTVKDNLLLCATLGGHINEATLSYCDFLVETLKLGGVTNKYPDELSGGQCQRVAIARALVYKPSLIILDEPTGALDSENERIVMELLSGVNKELGTTLVQVTHSRRVADYGSRVITLSDGKIQDAKEDSV